MAVRQMSPVREVHAEDRVARFEQGEVDGHVGLRARMRLHVDVFGAEQLLGARDRKRLGDVDEFAPTVITLAGISLRVLVRHHRTGSLEYGAADEVLRCNQFEAFGLTPRFVLDCACDFGVGFGERTLHGRESRGGHEAKLYYAATGFRLPTPGSLWSEAGGRTS